jgi:hypothetical protein
MKVGPFHSRHDDTIRHHNNNQCPVGSKIISTDRARGRGGYPLCEQCRLLDRDRKAMAQPAVRIAA